MTEITPAMKAIATDFLFWMAIVIFVVHVSVRVKKELVLKNSSDCEEREFWSLLSIRTLICAIVTIAGAMVAMVHIS